MMKKAVQYGFYAALVVVILTLSGIFETFSDREIIRDVLTLDVVSLFLMFAIPAYIVVTTSDERKRLNLALAGAISALMVAGGLLLLIVMESVIPYPDIRFVFQNYQRIIGTNITFGYEEAQLLVPGILLMLAFAAATGAISAMFATLSRRWQTVIGLSFGLTFMLALLESQVRNLFTLPDAVSIIIAFGIGYLVTHIIRPRTFIMQMGFGFFGGAIVGAILTILAGAGVFAEDGALTFGGSVPVVLSGITDPLLPFVLGFGIIGLAGAVIATGQAFYHNAGIILLATMLALGILNTQGRMTELVTALILGTYLIATVALKPLGKLSVAAFTRKPEREKRGINVVSMLAAGAVVLIAPVFLGQYISNILDLVMLYIIMGIGLNVMVGFAGLLDLGYVASFAIGAYTCALLTTPSIITLGCVPVEAIEGMNHAPMCTGLLESWSGTGLFSFWGAWPIAVLVSAFTGMALGVPVLRLRGDYLAIVTLGFGEITRVLARANATKPLLGSAQGIPNVPYPVLDFTGLNPAWYIEFNDATSIYYLYVFAIVIATFVVMRLAGSRLGRAWRAIRADEDVAEAMGVHLVGTKLLAFGVSSAFAGLGGAVFAAQLRGIFPDSFTILVSINVLSLIIIGGLGSIPGVFVGALVLVGLPEILRELQSYRLLAFGSLLVIAMLLKPDGLVPPPVRQLSERVLPSRKTASEQGDT